MSNPQQPNPPPTSEGKVLGWITAAKGLTISNVLVLAALAAVAMPVYVIYKAIADPSSGLMDRLLSTYEEQSSQMHGCTLRHVQARGGPEQWAISTGFAFQGGDRWQISVVLDHDPKEELDSYCATAKILADSMLQTGGP